MIDTTKTYVFSNAEVKMTGRRATREVQVDSTVVRKGNKEKIHDLVVLYEIEPVDPHGEKWKKWVRFQDLYEIADDSAEH